MSEIGRIESVDIREVWRHEAKDFTQWMENNLDTLDDVLGLGLTIVEREQSVGAFSVDLVADDFNGDLVAIENQLERTDHTHLGQLVTYISNLEAKTAIWISVDPKPEHVKAVVWLNELTPVDVSFYLVKVNAIRIDESPAAPLFTIVAGPTEIGKAIGRQKEEMAARHVGRVAFFQALIERCKTRTPKFGNLKPNKYGWISISAGVNGLSYSYVVRKDGAQIELYIDLGKGRDEENKAIFDKFLGHKEEIENAFGDALIWERLDGKRACRISRRYEGIGWRDEENWEEFQNEMIDDMAKFEKSLKPWIRSL